jgi:hypothetical protein
MSTTVPITIRTASRNPQSKDWSRRTKLLVMIFSAAASWMVLTHVAHALFG